MSEKNSDTKPEEQTFLNNEKFEIPEEGMLGLLALGDVGLKMWRKKRGTVADALKISEDLKDGNADNDGKNQ